MTCNLCPGPCECGAEIDAASLRRWMDDERRRVERELAEVSPERLAEAKRRAKEWERIDVLRPTWCGCCTPIRRENYAKWFDHPGRGWDANGSPA